MGAHLWREWECKAALGRGTRAIVASLVRKVRSPTSGSLTSVFGLRHHLFDFFAFRVLRIFLQQFLPCRYRPIESLLPCQRTTPTLNSVCACPGRTFNDRSNSVRARDQGRQEYQYATFPISGPYIQRHRVRPRARLVIVLNCFG